MNLITEEWRPVSDFPNYEVSNFGRVKNVKSGVYLHPYNDFRGYLRVDLCNNGYKKPKKLHRVVAEAFCEHPIGKEYVNHINFDRHDCRACNLEWVTQQENIIHMYTRAKLYPSECQPTFDSENALPY